jgi:hypothetical protein
MVINKHTMVNLSNGRFMSLTRIYLMIIIVSGITNRASCMHFLRVEEIVRSILLWNVYLIAPISKDRTGMMTKAIKFGEIILSIKLWIVSVVNWLLKVMSMVL